MSQSESRGQEQYEALQARLAALEAQGRRFRRRQLALIAALVAVVIVAAARPDPDVITARQFALLDANGNECGVWGSAPPSGNLFGRAYLTFRRSDQSSGIAVSLEAGDGNPSLLLQGQTSRLNDHWAESSVSLHVDSAEGAQLSLRANPRGSAPASAAIQRMETRIGMLWAEGKPCFFATFGDKQVWAAP